MRLLRPTPRSADRARSPARFSQKREYFKCRLETIGDFALRLLNFGAWRRRTNLQKPAIGGPFYDIREYNLRLTDWLAWAGGLETPHGGIQNHLPTRWCRP